MGKWLKIILKLLSAGLFIGLLSGIIWFLDSLEAMPEAYRALDSLSVRKIEDKNWWIFIPEKEKSLSTGLIFYPGAKVQPEAYAPFLKELADEGFFCVLIKMPLNYAFFSIGEGLAVVERYPEISTWILSGHSLGGAMAAELAADHQDVFKGLVLFASYPAGNNDLSEAALKIASVYAEYDGLADPLKITNSLPLLPTDSALYLIKGGNHARFGYYGAQSGDGEASISREEQTEIMKKSFMDYYIKFFTR